MWESRLIEVLMEWFRTGRFPREELRVRPWLAIAFALTVLGLLAAYLLHSLAT